MSGELLEAQPLQPKGDPKTTPSSRPPIWGWAFLLLVLMLGLWGINRCSQITTPVPLPPTPAPLPTPAAPPDPALRAAAESDLGALLTEMAVLRPARPEIWAEAAWTELETEIEKGDAAMARADFPAASTAYRRARALTLPLRERLPRLPEELLPLAKTAYAAGERDRAVNLLEAVLAVAPDHPESTALLPRARMADQSFALLQQAREKWRSGESALAWADLQMLAGLDDAFPGGAELRSTVGGAVARDAFAEAVAKAGTAADEDRLEEAESWAAEAAAFFPEDPALRDLRDRLQALRTGREVTALRAQAREQEQAENWEAAHALWLRIASLDPHSPGNAEGLAASLRWKRIEEQLTRMQAHPASEQTGRWLEEFGDRTDWPPGLAREAEAAKQRWELWHRPVRVLLASDAETEVLIPGVGRWAPFVEKEIQLKPGEYVARGSRLGYRDVRIPFTVKPGEEGKRLEVRCVEGI